MAVTRGRWVIAGIALVALVMAFATWPLLKIRRQKEIRRTELHLKSLQAACRDYRQNHGRFPDSLADLKLMPREPRDAWGRPVQSSHWCAGENAWRYDLTSLGPDPDDPHDDIVVKILYYR